MSALKTLSLSLGFAALVVAGCQGEIGLPPSLQEVERPDGSTVIPLPGADASTPQPGADAGVAGQPDATATPFVCQSGSSVGSQRVYDGLSPTCVTCHGAGTARPYFSSRTAFDTLIASRSEWVVPGQPGQSQLLKLLRGERPPPYTQMPLGGDPFVTMAEQGRTSISMAELECWIGGLTATPTVAAAGPLPVARRLSAEQMIQSLVVGLGVDPSRFSPNEYGVQSPDEVPQLDPYRQLNSNFHLLGGPQWMTGLKRSNQVDSALIQMWVNLSQRACRAAVGAATDNVIFTAATSGDSSASQPQKIRDNINNLSWRLLAIRPTTAELDEYFQLFVAYEPASRTTAWTAVCAAMLRDPLWLSW